MPSKKEKLASGPLEKKWKDQESVDCIKNESDYLVLLRSVNQFAIVHRTDGSDSFKVVTEITTKEIFFARDRFKEVATMLGYKVNPML